MHLLYCQGANGSRTAVDLVFIRHMASMLPERLVSISE
jgi:hypothetical protein